MDDKKKLPASLKHLNGILTTKKHINNIEEYVRVIRMLTDYWELERAWFRGHSDEDYKLLPGIYRRKYDSQSEYTPEFERAMEDEYIRRARMFTSSNLVEQERWHWYQLMQHHGLPTRLLDWTESALTALYFALSDELKGNAAIWVLDPFKFNEFTTDNVCVYYTDPTIQDASEDAISSNYVPSRVAMPEYPIAVYPAHSIPRVALQKGCFTVHGRGKQPIEELFQSSSNPKLAKIVVNGTKAVSIKTDLKILGLTHTTLFPDLDGLAKELRWEYQP